MGGGSATNELSSPYVHLILHCRADGTKTYVSCTDSKPATIQGETEDLEDLVDRFCLATWAGTRIVRSCLLSHANDGKSLPDRDQGILQTCLDELAKRLGRKPKARIDVHVGQTSEHLKDMSQLYTIKAFEIRVTTDEGSSVRPCVATWCDSTVVPTERTDKQADEILLELVVRHAWGSDEIEAKTFDSTVDPMLDTEQDNVIDADDLVAVTHAVRAARNFLNEYPQ